jgi:hypothetical protein
MRQIALAALVALSVAAPVRGQPTPGNLMKTIETLQRQVDQLQARLDGQESFARATIDFLTEAPGVVNVQGWAFACGQGDGGRLVIVVDGVQSVQSTASSYYRWQRTDVNNQGNAELCARVGAAVPTEQAGFGTVVSMEPFEPGEYGDHFHTIKVRIYDRYGRMSESRPVTIQFEPVSGQHTLRQK